jgi:hypothetical protein
MLFDSPWAGESKSAEFAKRWLLLEKGGAIHVLEIDMGVQDWADIGL